MRPKANIQLLDPATVRHRRMELGLTESYLGSLCGVSSSVIRRLESNWPQDDLSARFVALLADRLGVHVEDLLACQHRSIDDTGPSGDGSDARTLGAILLAAREPVPYGALCDVLDWGLDRLHDAIEDLASALEPAGGAVIDNDATLTVVDDLAPVPRQQVIDVARAAFARRRPTLPELRVVHQLVNGKVVRREDLDTATGRTVGRLRTVGVLANADKPDGVKSDPPKLSGPVSFSLEALLSDDPSASCGAEDENAGEH